MRTARSFFAMSSSAPSSIPLRPSFHSSATRSAYCSTVSGAVLGTIKTAIWLPLRNSSSRSLRSSSAFCSAVSVAVWSMTRAVSGGTGSCAQAAEQRVGFQLRIVLRHREEAGKRARQLGLRRLEPGERLGVVDQLGRRLDGPSARACLGDLPQDLLLLRGIAFHRVDEVRHQVGAALVLVQHLGPGRLDLLVPALQLVVAAAGQKQGAERRNCHHESTHGFLLAYAGNRRPRSRSTSRAQLWPGAPVTPP